ncbi:MAG TPA: hypothetical protein VGD87_00090 [Archangium sp.]
MHNGQTNTGSRGLKVVSPKAGFERLVERRVGVVRVQPFSAFDGLGKPLMRIGVASSYATLDRADVKDLIAALQETADEVFA